MMNEPIRDRLRRLAAEWKVSADGMVERIRQAGREDALTPEMLKAMYGNAYADALAEIERLDAELKKKVYVVKHTDSDGYTFAATIVNEPFFSDEAAALAKLEEVQQSGEVFDGEVWIDEVEVVRSDNKQETEPPIQ